MGCLPNRVSVARLFCVELDCPTIIYFTTFVSFYENEQTLVALLPSVDIYIPTVYTSPPSPRYSRFPPFIPLDYGGPCSGGSNIKKGFLDCEFWRFPKNSISLNPK